MSQLLVDLPSGALIRSGTVIYAGCKFGLQFQTGHGVLIRENCKIGDNVSVGSHSVIEHSVILGNNVRIHSNTFIPEFTTIKDYAWIGPCVVITNSKYPDTATSKEEREPVTIHKHARIGAGAVILPGVQIEHHALVGAGAVVTKDVEPFAVVAGNPARQIGRVDEHGCRVE